MSAKTFSRLRVTVKPEDYDRMLGMLALFLPYGWEEKETPDGIPVFEASSETPGYLETIQKQLEPFFTDAEFSLAAEELPDPLESWKEFFTPVRCGKSFVVIPPWLADKQFFNPIKIIINPKSAFGTGHHASTCLCLACLDDLFEKGLLKQGDSFLDLGCGSGILGIAATLLGLTGTGMDEDALAVENAIENATLNNVKINLAIGDETSLPKEGFELVLANILAAPLIGMAQRLVRAVKPGGWIVLSGILGTQAEDVRAAYENCGMVCMNRLDSGEWAALALQKNA